MAAETLFLIGRVAGVHGLKGKLKVKSDSEPVETFGPGINLKFQSSGEDNGLWYEVVKAVGQKNGILLTLKGVEDIDAAVSLKGKEIFIKRDDLPEPGDNSYFWQDLIGLEVFDKEQGNLGKIDHIIETGANDVFVVKSHDKRGTREILVPAIESVVIGVNIKEGTMEIKLPKGL